MLDHRNGISFQQTVDPQACNLGNGAAWKELSRDPQRTPFQWNNATWAGFSSAGSKSPWLPIHPNYKYLNVNAQSEATRSTYKYYQQLSAIRKLPTFTHGNFNAKVVGQNVLSYIR